MDEADQMLDIGFERAINLILATMPKQRRTGLFSATLNENVLRYVKIILFFFYIIFFYIIFLYNFYIILFFLMKKSGDSKLKIL